MMELPPIHSAHVLGCQALDTLPCLTHPEPSIGRGDPLLRAQPEPITGQASPLSIYRGRSLGSFTQQCHPYLTTYLLTGLWNSCR